MSKQFFYYEQLNNRCKIHGEGGKEIYLDDLLKEIKKLNITEINIWKEVSLFGTQFIIQQLVKDVYSVEFEDVLFDLFEPIKLILNEKTNYDIYSRWQFRELKGSFPKKTYKLFLNSNQKKEEINEEIYKYSGKEIIIEFVYKQKMDDTIFLRDNNNNQLKLKDLTLNYIELFTEKFDTSIYKQKVFKTEKREKLEKFIERFMFKIELDPNNNYIYMCRRSGIGKTVTFLDFRYKMSI